MRYLFCVLALLNLSGCAAVLGSKQKQFDLRSDPPEAEVYRDGNRLGTTPFKIKLSNLTDHTFVFRKPGYKDASCSLVRGTSGGWVVLDILFGLVPVVIDAATNSWSQTQGNGCHETLQPTTAARSQPAPQRIQRVAPEPAPITEDGPAPSPMTVPRGTKFIGDPRTKQYYSVDCPVVDEIQSEDRFFFRTEAGAQASGYIRGSC